jgi:hypothetical protein
MDGIRAARRKLAGIITEADKLERLEDERDLAPHEWSRLSGLYREMTFLEAFLAGGARG